MPKSDPLTKRFCDFLFPTIDLYDWGIKQPDWERPVRRNTSETLNLFYCQRNWPAAKRTCFPKRLTHKLVRQHLNGELKLYFVPRRKSGGALVMIDVDAHKRQTDAREVADFIRESFFPGAYWEPSARGYHIYPMIQVGRVFRDQFNERLKTLERDLRALVRQSGFQSTVEVTGRFTIMKRPDEIGTRGQMGAFPRLPNGLDDLDQLLKAPGFTILALDAVGEEARKLAPAEGQNADSSVLISSSLPDVYVSRKTSVRKVTPDLSSAWDRMMHACFQFTEIYRRLPSVDELLAFYQEVFKTGEGTSARRKRALQAIAYRARQFDPVKAQGGGYEANKAQLLTAVKRFCIDRRHKAGTGITDEDLAITLYTITQNSFLERPNRRHQFTCPAASIAGMFKSLRAAGVTRRAPAAATKWSP